jgi:hypothetical protein
MNVYTFSEARQKLATVLKRRNVRGRFASSGEMEANSRLHSFVLGSHPWT